MTKYENQRLCGGTFFVLLQQAKKQRTSQRKKIGGDTDGLSEPEMLTQLIRVAYPEYKEATKDSFKTITSSYKTCRIASGAYLPFKKLDIQSAFDVQIKNHYAQSLISMSKFTNFFIDVNHRGNWLVVALLELIESDNSISDDDLFYIEDNVVPINKKAMLKMTDIKFQSFLLGLWHFIVTKRPDNNVGRDTFNSWHEAGNTKRAPRKFISDIGNKSNRTIRLQILDHSNERKLFEIPSTGLNQHLKYKLKGNTMSAEILKPTEDFSIYLQNTYDKYSCIKTLLYSDQPRKFYDFYVCNNVYQKINSSQNTYLQKYIFNTTINDLIDYSNFIILSGTGGLGKSMMMRHLLLDAIKNYEKINRIPIFISLKDFSENIENFVEYIYALFNSLDGEIDISKFEELLCNGDLILLFDGLDEINSSLREHFERNFSTFSDKYSKNMFVISSRPFGNFVSFNRFTVLHLEAFSKVQALELIDKLDFRSDEPAIKTNFRNELNNSLYWSHREFTQNPLLLTIMLLTYELFAEVPSKMHVFYHEAYLALSQKHDASKGAFKRALKTGLTSDRFSDNFAEFCARTYRDEKFELTDIEFTKYFEALAERKKDVIQFDVTDFIHDLVSNMCLMYYESGKYHFTHRSFQEYFCALFFSKQKDKNLQHIGAFFDSKHIGTFGTYGDKTFYMLYDMIPEKVEEYIFIPFLTNLFNECDNGNGYWTFLENMYPVISYESGFVPDSYENTSSSFMYNFIVQSKNLHEIVDTSDFPFYEEFITDEYGYYNENWLYEFEPESWVLSDLNDIELEYKREFGVPDIEGYYLDFSIKGILEQKESYLELLNVLNDDEFALKKEYNNVRKYLGKLIKEQTATGKDLFDFF
ncbi:NACHT domain-containing protein [uncultured Acetobacterium sp.]|uniref:NACHT domain-containing protein n=1 Tax=uncultured Acetobacterium sp. TaxID=217139 RepID=UPI0025F646ED|nr:NACHT domain-containing protein [uncultured Acetobacterium sp.]